MQLDETIKPAVPGYNLDLSTGWEAVPEAAPGVFQKLLSGSLDEENKVGVRTRLIKFEPGALVPHEFVHPYWEEVYLVSGELILGCNENGDGGDTFTTPSYACRPPGTPHGPFTTKTGCTFFEIQYFA